MAVAAMCQRISTTRMPALRSPQKMLLPSSVQLRLGRGWVAELASEQTAEHHTKPVYIASAFAISRYLVLSHALMLTCTF